MRVLLVNKFHYLRGGSEKYYFELGELLKKHGHEIAFFSMTNEKNISTGNKEYFVDEIDMNTGSKLQALNVIYSKKNKALMKKALDEFKPDIVHINNFQRQLSASILDAIKENNIPVVMTAHDFNPVCPASIMLYDGEICEDCIKKGCSQCFKKKCIKDSTLKSLLGTLEKKYYDMRKMFKKFDCIVSPSEFVKDKLIEGKLNCNEIRVIHNFVNESKHEESKPGNYAFYFGRLSKEKGIMHLVKAIREIENARLIIAGEGDEREHIEEYIKNNNLQERITLIGYQNQDNIRKYITNARFIVVPSIWYENCPYSILETMEIGKPVIASDIGGIPELVSDGINGYLYEPNDIHSLKEKLKLLFESDELAKTFGKNSRELFNKNYTAERYYSEIIKIYSSLLSLYEKC